MLSPGIATLADSRLDVSRTVGGNGGEPDLKPGWQIGGPESGVKRPG